MISIRLKGGMGNQMFQYSLGVQLRHLLQTELKVDLTNLLDRSKSEIVPRDYDLSIFHVPENFVFSPQLLRLLYFSKSSSITRTMRNRAAKGMGHFKETKFEFDSTIISRPHDNIVYEGWFQSYKYFEGVEKEVREIFKFKEGILTDSKSLLLEIEQTNSVCLNVRRTDFLKVDTLNTTNLKYFLKAAKIMETKVDEPHFFIFSDDILWCNEHIKLNSPTTFVDHTHKGERFGNYMQLMIACDHFIIPNSSFAWWTTWLNENKKKVVIAPENWFNDPAIDTSDVTPAGWLRI